MAEYKGLNNAQDEANSVVWRTEGYINKQALSDDVVPRSEVEALQEMLDATIAGQITLQKALLKAKTEIALKAIKEVEQTLTVKIINIEKDFFHGTASHWDGTKRDCYEEILVEIAELKKKYTE